MRARYPDQEGFVERDGVEIFYEVTGTGDVAVLFLPTWSALNSRVWRLSVPYLSRYFKVITFDGRGNGRSGRPRRPEAYAEKEFAADAVAVLDAVGVDRAVTVSLSLGARWNLILGAEHPERVLASIYVGPVVPLGTKPADRAQYSFRDRADSSEGWAKFNMHYWKENYQDFLQWYFEITMSEPHSSKGIELCVDWGLETDADILINTMLGCELDAERVRALCDKVEAPCLVIHGDDDRVQPLSNAERFVEALGARLIVAEGCGHGLCCRHPVWFNLTVKDFVDQVAPPPRDLRTRNTWRRSMHRPKRVLYLSSPIGLGHARRDVAIADELRKQRPGLEIDWLTQAPVDRILLPRGERMHPACTLLASEVAHIESQSDDHGQPIFPIFRNMDEILVANFMVFLEVMEREKYDLVVADEGWEVDHFLHEHPEYKKAPMVWATDVIGFLPTAQGDEPADPSAPRKMGRDYEELLAADYNTEMIERIERFPRVRDLSLYIGDAEDVPEGTFGPGLPSIRGWTDEHYTYGGYVLGFDPDALADREGIRAELGYRPDEKVCIVAVGGMATGQNLLRKAIAAFPRVKRRVPALRMIVVAGPRIDPDSLWPDSLRPGSPGATPMDGLEVRGFVHELYRHMAVCDLAIVHGGLTQTMDLTANHVPFIVVPYLRQFEQNVWVRRRLANYGAGRYLDYRDLRKDEGPEILAAAIAEELEKGPRRYRPVERGAEISIASMIAELL